MALPFQAAADVAGAAAYDVAEPVIAGAFIVVAATLLAGFTAAAERAPGGFRPWLASSAGATVDA